MLFETKQYVPLIYRNSRDYQSLLKLLDIILTTVKYETDSLINLYIPEMCDENFLTLLAEHIGYTYNYSDTVDTNRIIIANFIKMIRNRGSVKGIRFACALSLNSLANIEISQSYTDIQEGGLPEIDIFYDYEEGKIIVIYPQGEIQARHLIDWVRPVGMWCEEMSGKTIHSSSDMTIDAYANVLTVPYNSDQFGRVEWSEIWDGIVSESGIKDIPCTWKDASYYTWYEISEFTWESFLEDLPTSMAVYITYVGNGGTFNVPNVIQTYSGLTITTLSSDDIDYGINKLLGWTTSYGAYVQPNTQLLIDRYSNFSLEADWQIVTKNSFILDLDILSTTIQTLNIRPLFQNTNWHLMIEYRADSSSDWETKDVQKELDSSDYDYSLDETTGQYKVTIGYDETIAENINLDVFNDDLFAYSSVVDLSELTDLTDDIFSNALNNEIIADNDYISTFKFPPNITELTIPTKFLYNCTSLETVVFPTEICNFMFNQDNNGEYSSNFLYNMGANIYTNTPFVIPTNITFVYKDFDSYTHNYVQLFNNLSGHKDIILRCNVLSDDLIIDDPLIALSINALSPNTIELLSIEGKINIYDIDSNDILDNLYVSSNCSLNDFANIHNLASIATTSVQIATDEYGATIELASHQFYNGNVENIILGDAISVIGAYALSNLPNVTRLYIPLSIQIIPKTAIQGNTALETLQFGNANTLTIQGCHKLTSLESIIIPDCDSLNTCFYNCYALTTLNLGSVTNIDYQTIFVGCSQLTNLNVSSTNYTSINNVLYSNGALLLLWVPWGISDVTTNSNTTTICSYSFSGCPANKLSAYVLNETINSDIINYYSSVTLTENVVNIESNAFDLTNITTLTVYNPNLDTTNITNCTIDTIIAPIGSTMHQYAMLNNIAFEPLNEISNNVNGLITNNLGENIYT